MENRFDETCPNSVQREKDKKCKREIKIHKGQVRKDPAFDIPPSEVSLLSRLRTPSGPARQGEGNFSTVAAHFPEMKGTCSFRFFQAGQRKKLHLDSLQ
jgi:hypothetical protein